MQAVASRPRDAERDLPRAPSAQLASTRIDGLVLRYTFGRASRSAFSIAKGLLLVAAALVATVELLDASHPILLDSTTALALFAIIAATVLAAVGLAARMWWTPEQGALVVGDDDVAEFHSADGVRCVPVSAFVHGIALSTHRGWVVLLEAEDGDEHSIGCPDAATADRVLARLRLGATERRYPVRWGQGAARVVLAGMLGLAASCAIVILQRGRGDTMLPSYFTTGLIPLVPLAIAWAVRTFGWRELSIGADGVVVEHIGFSKRFLPYARIADIHDVRGNIVFLLDDGEAVSVWAKADDSELRRAVLRRIAQARAASFGAAARVALVARSGRPVGEWREALAAQLGQTDGYRAAAICPEDASRLLSDAASAAEQRIAAAVALVATGDLASRTRVRVAAAACASPSMRVALERAADERLNEAVVDAAISDDAPDGRRYAGVREGDDS